MYHSSAGDPLDFSCYRLAVDLTPESAEISMKSPSVMCGSSLDTIQSLCTLQHPLCKSSSVSPNGHPSNPRQNEAKRSRVCNVNNASNVKFVCKPEWHGNYVSRATIALVILIRFVQGLLIDIMAFVSPQATPLFFLSLFQGRVPMYTLFFILQSELLYYGESAVIVVR